MFPIHKSNPGHLHCRQILYHLSHQGNPIASLVSGFFFFLIVAILLGIFVFSSMTNDVEHFVMCLLAIYSYALEECLIKFFVYVLVGLFAFLLLSFKCSLIWSGKGNGNPLQYSCLENPRDGGAWWAAIYGVA